MIWHAFAQHAHHARHSHAGKQLIACLHCVRTHWNVAALYNCACMMGLQPQPHHKAC